MNLTFFQGLLTGALIATIIIFIIMAVLLGRIKTENKTGREKGEEQMARSLELMKERNTQDLITHQCLKIIGLHLGEIVRIYKAR